MSESQTVKVLGSKASAEPAKATIANVASRQRRDASSASEMAMSSGITP